MGGASESLRLLTLGVALWCVLAPSCTTAAESPSTTVGEARGESPDGSGAGQGFAEAGQSGEPFEPAIGAGGGDAREPSPAAGGSSAGSSAGGGRNVLGDPSGGEASGGAEGDPSCGKQEDGTMCGPNMTPPGPEGARYFCSAGVIIAEAACPGPCDAETNACVQSGGTGGGMGETGFATLLRCRECYATQCRAQLMACDADPLCTAHLGCYESCSLDDVCYATCSNVFATEPLLGELDGCVELTGCADKCPTE